MAITTIALSSSSKMAIMVQGISSPFLLSQVHTTTASSSSSSSTCVIKKPWRAVAAASAGGGRASAPAPTSKLQRRRRPRPSATEQHHFGSWTGVKTKNSAMPLAPLRRAIVQTSDVVGAAADVAAAPETETETEEEEKKRAAAGVDGYSAVIQPSPSPGSPVGLASLVLDGLEKALVWAFHDSSLPPHFISGDYAPTTETPPCSSLPVIGHLPSCLNGEFVRVGPNPKFKPVAGYHWFDGDGMIHGLRIKDGKATYVSRYVRTSKLLQEEFFGAAKFMKLGDSIGIFGLFMSQITKYRAKFKVLDTSEGTGTGNTALTYHGGRLLALHEADKPYAIKISEDGDLQTLGYLDYGKQLNHPFTAHPKVDPVTGEMFMFGYQFEEPYCVYRVISKEGEIQDAVPITLSGPSMMHDFAITENYAIFMDLPLSYKPEVMLKGNMFLSFDPSKKSRFGILPRYAKDDSQMQWFELPNCYIFHNANAWEEGDEVVLYSCLLSNANLEIFAVPLRESVKCYDTALYELRFNRKTGHASWKQLSVSTVDLPRINDKYIGRKQRYVYGIIMENNKNKGIAKFDLNSAPDLEGKREIETGGNVKVFSFGPGRYGSEAVFVPKTSGADESEDDGYLITFCYDENTRKSEALVIDAKTMAPEPAAAVHIPSGIPFGFHAVFVSEEELQKQKV